MAIGLHSTPPFAPGSILAPSLVGNTHIFSCGIIASLNLSSSPGDLELANLLMAAGADPNQASLEGVTPLMAASFVGNADLVRQLIDAGARTEPQDRMHRPAAVYAAGQGHGNANWLKD